MAANQEHDKAYASRKELESRFEGDPDGDLSLYRASMNPETFKEKIEDAPVPQLRFIEYEDREGKRHAVFMTLTADQHSILLEYPAYGLALFAETIVHRVDEGNVTPKDHEIAIAAFLARYPGVSASDGSSI